MFLPEGPVVSLAATEDSVIGPMYVGSMGVTQELCSRSMYIKSMGVTQSISEYVS